ncbi:hypothetical protein [Alteromonas flava]|uniref:hypothetical protein n=1 Tax=Alteromonas flava TaxID=2048003 RepID=UPI000C293A9E|nr:hypothetical protein [Alteromonas flava]
MRHPFATPCTATLDAETATTVNAGAKVSDNSTPNTSPNDGKARAIQRELLRPPTYYTQALGEDGGYVPEPDLT